MGNDHVIVQALATLLFTCCGLTIILVNTHTFTLHRVGNYFSGCLINYTAHKNATFEVVTTLTMKTVIGFWDVGRFHPFTGHEGP